MTSTWKLIRRKTRATLPFYKRQGLQKIFHSKPANPSMVTNKTIGKFCEKPSKYEKLRYFVLLRQFWEQSTDRKPSEKPSDKSIDKEFWRFRDFSRQDRKSWCKDYRESKIVDNFAKNWLKKKQQKKQNIDV